MIPTTAAEVLDECTPRVYRVAKLRFRGSSLIRMLLAVLFINSLRWFSSNEKPIRTRRLGADL